VAPLEAVAVAAAGRLEVVPDKVAAEAGHQEEEVTVAATQEADIHQEEVAADTRLEEVVATRLVEGKRQYTS